MNLADLVVLVFAFIAIWWAWRNDDKIIDLTHRLQLLEAWKDRRDKQVD